MNENKIDNQIQLNRMAVFHMVQDYIKNIAEYAFEDELAVIFFKDKEARNGFVKDLLNIGILVEISLGEISVRISF
jgi:hypothetical protein